jgi:hypothetical protein
MMILSGLIAWVSRENNEKGNQIIERLGWTGVVGNFL